MLRKRLSSSAQQRCAPRPSSLSNALLAPTLLFAGLLLPTQAALAGPFTDPGWDPVAMVAWATSVDDFARGLQDVAQPGLGLASFGVPENSLGAATGDSFDVVSLGDAGSITLYFDVGIGDGIGDDFAVFENSFFTIGGLFAELGFVEVSTDGDDFARFPATALNAIPVASFDPLDPTDYENLAGDQPLGVGTGFDLRDIADDPLVLTGVVHLTDIRYVRVIDAIGNGSTADDFDAPIYDPYPTAFASGGFDLEAIGVIHDAPEPGGIAPLATGVLALVGRRSRRRGCAGER